MHHFHVYPGRQADIKKLQWNRIFKICPGFFLKKCINTLIENHIKYSCLLITSNQILVC